MATCGHTPDSVDERRGNLSCLPVFGGPSRVCVWPAGRAITGVHQARQVCCSWTAPVNCVFDCESVMVAGTEIVTGKIPFQLRSGIVVPCGTVLPLRFSAPVLFVNAVIFAHGRDSGAESRVLVLLNPWTASCKSFSARTSTAGNTPSRS